MTEGAERNTPEAKLVVTSGEDLRRARDFSAAYMIGAITKMRADKSEEQ